ncbi:hypothetical protein P389DRAFT_108984 [Cystobasidium minutum MCA 4210]|uniref:uncharacterized protein n=1 Tax=Cystobasidium minutum MCA 4210 TaxID=1397322 RepID=UPI0034CE677B|eukprot:jgi/Rhomi1/108984/CE108983_239
MAERNRLTSRIAQLRAELAELEVKLEQLNNESVAQKTPTELPLKLDEYRRYGRQMILPGIGLPGQLKLKHANILVVGAGGLGCPLMLYLAGAGIGSITIVDEDTVEISNLHRQVLHTYDRVGMAKVESARIGIKSINPRVAVRTINRRFTPQFVRSDRADERLDIATFDLMVDCTDNAPTRYLLSDLAVSHGKPLVSGGAVGLEGWVGVWNLPAALPQGNVAKEEASIEQTLPPRGPCLRCIYPQSQHDNSGNCEDDGILGTVVGTIGILMANEAIKLLVGLHDLKPSMTLFSPLSSPMFRTLKLRGRKPTCPGCGNESDALSVNAPESSFAPACGTEETMDDVRVSAKQLQEAVQSGKPYVLIDVRPEVEYGICALPDSINIPHTQALRQPELLMHAIPSDKDVYLVCRRGNDSLIDARLIKKRLASGARSHTVRDLRGGLQAWHQLQPEFPLY